LLRDQLGASETALRVARQLGSTEAVKQAVRHRLGVSLVIAAAVRDEVANGELRAVTIEGRALTKRLFWITRTPSAASHSLQAFRNVLVEHY